MNNETIKAMHQGLGPIVAVVLGYSSEPNDPKRKEDTDSPIPESDQEVQSEKRENIGPDGDEWQNDQLKEDPNRDEGLRDKPQSGPINRARDSI